ncbi:MAG: hypothetical protein J6Q54_01020 [Oscillospiraceae bacterium]|nr:hypothetical protein [Oscillospiraceae bacterium]
MQVQPDGCKCIVIKASKLIKSIAHINCPKMQVSNPPECNSPVDCCLPPAGWRRHLNFLPSGKNANRVLYRPPKRKTTHTGGLFFLPDDINLKPIAIKDTKLAKSLKYLTKLHIIKQKHYPGRVVFLLFHSLHKSIRQIVAVGYQPYAESLSTEKVS